MKTRMKPGQNCCTPACIIYQDDFSTNTIANFTADAGSWSISSGMVSTSSSNARLRINSTSSSGHGRVKSKFRFISTPSTLMLIGSYVDANNYLFAEVSSSGNFKLWKRVSGTNTQIGSTIFLGASLTTFTFYNLEVCWDGTTARALFYGLVSGAFTAQVISGSYTGTGSGAAVATGSVASTCSFDDLIFERHVVDDGNCTPCGEAVATCTEGLMNCDSGLFLAEIAVTINLTVTGNCASACDADDGTYIVPIAQAALHVMGGSASISDWILPVSCSDPTLTASEQCEYKWIYSPGTTDGTCTDPNPPGTSFDKQQPHIFVSLTKFSDGYRLLGFVHWRFDGPFSQFSDSYNAFASDVLSTSPLNCITDLDGVVLNFICNQWITNVGGSQRCTVTGGTMTISVP